MEDKKMLEKIMEQNDKIMQHIVGQRKESTEQYATIHGDLNTIKSELGSVKKATLENNMAIKEIKQNLDTAVTNHEERIRKLEEEVNI